MQSGQELKPLHPASLEDLAKLRGEQRPFYSLYLDLRAQAGERLLDRFDALVQQTRQAKRLGAAADHEIAEVRRWLEQQQPGEDKGLAYFYHAQLNYQQAFRLPVPVLDRLVVQDRPFLRPLKNLLDEFQCTLLALIDTGTAQLARMWLGSVEVVDQMEAIPVTSGTLEDGMEYHARAVAQRVKDLWQKQPCGRLALGGSAAGVTALRGALPEDLRQHLAGEVLLQPHAGIEEMVPLAGEVEAEAEQQLEARRVQEFAALAAQQDGTTVSGLEQTMLAVRSQRVRLLLVEEDYHQEGGECPSCGFLGRGEEGICLLCGMALRPEADIIEVAVKRVRAYGGEVEVLRSQDQRRALAESGHIAALLKPRGALPVERTVSNQQILAKDGKLYMDALHDEAIEQSFPGSDPPAW